MPIINNYSPALPVYEVDVNGNTIDDPSNTSGRAVVGNVNAATADSGAPVKIGAVFQSTKPTYTNTHRGNLQMDNRGSLQTNLTFAGADLATAVGLNVVYRGGSTLATGQIALGTTSTLIAAARTARQKITISPTSATLFYVGATGVTAANGLYVAAGASITLDTQAAVYGVAPSAVTVSYIELY